MTEIYYAKEYSFDNGYGASVVCVPQSYGYRQGLFEVAVLHKGQIVYDTPITSSTVPDCDHEYVARLLADIKALPERPAVGITEDVRNRLTHAID